MHQAGQKGYTIIEVLLFLSISAMLLTVALTSTNSTISNTRFSDATRSLEMFFKDQYTKVQTGSLAYSLPAGSNRVCSQSNDVVTLVGGEKGTCLLLGSSLEIQPDQKTINVYPVFGWAGVSPGDSSTELSNSNPRVWKVNGPTDTHITGWQSKISSRQSLKMTDGSPQSPINRIVILRSISSSKINLYFLTDNTTSNLVPVIQSDTGTVSNIRNVPALICLAPDGASSLRGQIMFSGNGQGTSFSASNITSAVGNVNEEVLKTTISPGVIKGLACGA